MQGPNDGGDLYALAIDPESALLEYLSMYYHLGRAGKALRSFGVIDFATTKVFRDRFISQGFTPTVQAFAGTDVSLTPRFAVTAEGRYQWARSRLSTDFSQFEPIDLSGFALTAGFSIRY